VRISVEVEVSILVNELLWISSTRHQCREPAELTASFRDAVEESGKEKSKTALLFFTSPAGLLQDATPGNSGTACWFWDAVEEPVKKRAKQRCSF
jgi:hypothetical protein